MSGRKDDDTMETVEWGDTPAPAPRRVTPAAGSETVDWGATPAPAGRATSPTVAPVETLDWGQPAAERVASGTFATMTNLDWADSLGDLDEPTEVSLDGPSVPMEIGVAEGSQRYERLELLGKGGMGEVWRVRDRELNRTVAMKVLRPKLLMTNRGLARFREEAQVASQLQHPGIIPIHDIGRLDDDRVWFTMKEVRGRTLEQLLQQFHDNHRRGRPSEQLSLRRLVDVFHRVCETVAYAHARAVIHRDLKPANIMIGDYGEVLVLDWGLAKVLGVERLDDPLAERVETTSSLDGDSEATRVGAVSGTPAYMPPEQARGQQHKLGPAADVYALGATLYDVLTERPPYTAGSVREMLDQVMSADPIEVPSAVAPLPIDDELDRITMKALAPRMKDRYPTASEMASDLALWLDGARKRARAMAIVEQAEALSEDADRAEREAADLARRAEAKLEGIQPMDPEEDKWPGWALHDDAAEAAQRAARTRAEATQLLRSALSHAPDLDEAHEALADTFHRQHKRLEEDGHDDDARVVQIELQAHDRGKYAAYLKGTGAVTLITDPEGAEVDLYKFELVRRRLQPVFVKRLGTTPLVRVPLHMGSYLLKVNKQGHDEVLYPVFITRQEHWHGVAPGESEARRIWMPKVGELDKDDCYVPAGWFWAGHRTEANALPWGKRWVEGCVMRRYPVTNAEYKQVLEFVLEADGDAAALELVPVFEVGHEPQWKLEGRAFKQQNDADGSVLRPTMPTYAVSFADGEALGAAYSRMRGQSWRLPTELEWEHAARGADGRLFAVGPHLDANWAWIRESWAEVPDILDTGAQPADQSLYGIRELTGGLSDWTREAHGEAFFRGGAWNRAIRSSHAAYRWKPNKAYAGANVTVRLVRSAST